MRRKERPPSEENKRSAAVRRTMDDESDTAEEISEDEEIEEEKAKWTDIDREVFQEKELSEDEKMDEYRRGWESTWAHQFGSFEQESESLSLITCSLHSFIPLCNHRESNLRSFTLSLLMKISVFWVFFFLLTKELFCFWSESIGCHTKTYLIYLTCTLLAWIDGVCSDVEFHGHYTRNRPTCLGRRRLASLLHQSRQGKTHVATSRLRRGCCP